MSVEGEIARVGVVGAGQMGTGIAEVTAAAGLEVRLLDSSSDALADSVMRFSRELRQRVGKEVMTRQESEELLARVTPTTDFSLLNDCDIAIEAVTENQELKLRVLQLLDEQTPPHAILASNTPSISLTKLADATRRPGLVIGMHFMNPVPRMSLVEIVRALQTSDATYEATRSLAERLGKTSITTRDMPGFIVNRMLIPFIIEACFALQEGLGTVEDIDQAAKLGLSHPMGPLALADLIGLDTCLNRGGPSARVRRRQVPTPYDPAQLCRRGVARSEDEPGLLRLQRSGKDRTKGGLAINPFGSRSCGGVHGCAFRPS